MKGKYWYFVVTTECPMCGRWDAYRERRYTAKPNDPKERYSYEQVYDYCDSL